MFTRGRNMNCSIIISMTINVQHTCYEANCLRLSNRKRNFSRTTCCISNNYCLRSCR
jgi:hypothetical protein